MPDLVFTRLHLPRPLGADSVAQLMTRLMSADAPRPLVFEVHASADGVTHLVGYPSAAAPRLKRLLRGHRHRPRRQVQHLHRRRACAYAQ